MERPDPPRQGNEPDATVGVKDDSVGFNALNKASELDSLAYVCLQIPSNQKIEQRECSQRLQTEVTALTQGQATAVGKIYERYQYPDLLPHNQNMGHEILFGSENSPIVTGFTYSAQEQRESRSRTITTRVAPPEAKWGLSQTQK